MGDLIVLPRVERQSRQAPTSDRGAEILFFTGVRYYCPSDETAAPVTRSRRRRPASDVTPRIDRHA